MSETDTIDVQADRLRAAGALGRSDVLQKLFEFLLVRSRAGASPKESEVAAEVFGQDTGFDASQDASVRVSVHRLRRKLDEYYAGPGKTEPARLTIPKGEYRIVIAPVTAGAHPPERPRLRASFRPWPPRPWLIATAIVLLLNGLVWAGVWWAQGSGDGLAQARRSAPWSALLKDQRPILLVMGDYYIFGDTDVAKGVDRLVREYKINSRDDLDAYLMQNPALAERYTDLDLYYLPVGAAFALRNLLPMIAATAADRDRVRTVLVSDLTPDMLKRNNIIYVGYLSGLGLLRDPAFAGSRFEFGDTYDELIDTTNKQRYISEAGGPEIANERHSDIGYFSTFTGPSGNHIVIIAGTRDIAVMQTAEEASKRGVLDAMIQKAGGADSFEAIFEVEGIRRSNLGGRLLLASPLKADKIWSAGGAANLKFPAG